MSSTAVAPRSTDLRSGVEDLGPFSARYTIRATRMGSRVLADLDLSFEVDLSVILPEFVLPDASIDVPGVGRVTTPKIPIDWPSVTVRVSFSDVVGDPDQLGAASASLLAAIALSVSRSMLDVPFGGPVLALALQQILAIVGVAGVTGFLGPVITPFFLRSRDLAA